MGSLDTEVRNYDPDDPPRFGEWVRVDGVQVTRKANGNTQSKPEVHMPIPQPPVDMPHRSMPTPPRHTIPIWMWGVVALALVIGIAGGVVIANLLGLIHKPSPAPAPPKPFKPFKPGVIITPQVTPGQPGAPATPPTTPNNPNAGGSAGGRSGGQTAPPPVHQSDPASGATPGVQQSPAPGAHTELPPQSGHRRKRHKTATARAGGANDPVTDPDNPNMRSPAPTVPKAGGAEPSISVSEMRTGTSTLSGQHSGTRPGENAMVITRSIPSNPVRW